MTANTADFDVIIIGGGPAGLSASLWCAKLGLKAVLLEKETELGGQLLWTFNTIKDYLGIEAANGRELRDRFLQHIENNDVRRLTGSAVASADLSRKTVVLAKGTSCSAKAIIIATGVRRRRLNVPGEEEFRGKGILESGVKAKDDVRGKTVVITGGGDAALENALILSETSEKVIVVHRRQEFSARKDFLERARKSENIEFMTCSRVTAIMGNTAVEAVELENLKSKKLATIKADHVLIRIGVVPNSELFRGQVALDDGGYICIDANCSTNLEGIYAAGDIANPSSPTISGAVGMAVAAVKSIYKN